jgi:CheY-like chemotaxis protein
VSAGSGPIRILTVDDHPLLRAGIEALVSSQADMLVVAESSNGRDAIQQFRKHRPDVTLMDLQMPEMSGTDAIIAIRGEFPDARIIVLTTYAGDVQALRALQAGARGYPEGCGSRGASGHDSCGPRGTKDDVAHHLKRNCRTCDGRRPHEK